MDELRSKGLAKMNEGLRLGVLPNIEGDAASF